MSTTTQPTPAPNVWQNWSFDKVGLATDWANIDPEKAKDYSRGAITVLNRGTLGIIHIHAEALNPVEPLLTQIARQLLVLANHKLFIPPIEFDIRQALACVAHSAGVVPGPVVSWLSWMFRLHELETAFDFVGQGPWTITNAAQLQGFETTLYSPDYWANGRRQRSLVSIYEHAACHGYPGLVTRLELRFCQAYVAKWDLMKLNLPPAAILTKYRNLIAGSLKIALPTTAIAFDIPSISITHPLLAPILERWLTWGRPKPPLATPNAAPAT